MLILIYLNVKTQQALPQQELPKKCCISLFVSHTTHHIILVFNNAILSLVYCLWKEEFPNG